MDWESIKKQGYKEVNGTRNSLDHLQDARYQVVIEASNKHPELRCTLLVQYSSHCVSWGPKHGATIDFSTHGEQRRIIDDKGVHRCFCDIRYKLSHHLPGIFKTFPDRLCLFTGRDNWLTVEIINASGQCEKYEVFFSITRQSRRMLRIYVESAYIREAGYPENKPVNLKRRDKVRAKVLLAKKLRGEPIRRPRGR